MLKLLILLNIFSNLLLVDGALNCVCGKSFKQRIIGGREVKKHSYPWMAGFVGHPQINGIFCGGALINDRYILTASHCMKGLEADQIGVALGAHYAEKLYAINKVEKIIMHEDFATETKYEGYIESGLINDMALIKLAKPVQFTTSIRPVCLEKEYRNDLSELKVIGWGATAKTATIESRSKVLLEVDVSGVRSIKCINSYGPWQFNDKTHICAGADGRDSCQGDSGGPLMVKDGKNYYITGVVSYGAAGRCGYEHAPGVYTRVSAFYDWIMDNTRDGQYCRSPESEEEARFLFI